MIINEHNQSLPYRLAEEFSIHTGRCLFITGKAGTGKTTFLRKLREESPKNMVVVAPTGVAAINAGGMTIHSFFQLPIRTLVPTPQSYHQLFAEQRMMQRKRNILYNLEVLVIDEISMVLADVLDAIDAVLRHYKYRLNTPFGGVQVIMIGDLFQLSPVVHGDDSEAMTKYYAGPYFFQSRVMQQIHPEYIEFNHIFRQQNEQFVRLLNEVRENRLTSEGRAMLATRYLPSFHNTEDDFHITLTTHNAMADAINHRELEQLSGKIFTSKAEVSGTFPESSYPTDDSLELKIGARVMFIRNDDQKPRRFYNGKLGIITDINGKGIIVECEDGDIEVTPMTWENIRYREDEQTGKIEEEPLGTFTQYPLRLAWAVTIHKSQGLTFDRVIIDAERAFAAGQVYVALSRCRTLEGIVLSSPLTNIRLGNDIQVVGYVNSQPAIEQVADRLSQAQQEYMIQVMTGVYDLHRLPTLVEQMKKTVKESVSFTEPTMPFLNNIDELCKNLLPVSVKFCEQLTKIIVSANMVKLQERLQAAVGYFVPLLRSIANALQSHPCRSKNKSDAGDFAILINELHITIHQKMSYMQALAESATIKAYLQAKKAFQAPPMTVDVFDKPAPKTKQSKKAQSPKKKKEDTFSITLEMFKNGLQPEDIAKERNMTIGTIFSHLSRFVALGMLRVEDIVPATILKRVQIAKLEHPEFTSVSEFHDHFNGKIDYGYIRLALTTTDAI